MKYMKTSLPIILYVALGMSVLVMVSVLVLVVYTNTHREAPPLPPIHYTQEDYYPDRAVYAPGDTLMYTPTLTINVGGRVDFLRTYWDDTRSQSARLCDGAFAPQDAFSRNLPRGIIGNARGGMAVPYTVPKLPPGHYRILNSATKPSGGESDYEVPFEIIETC